MINQDKYYTDLDNQLRQLANVDWPAFVDLIGHEAITAAKVCMLKKQGRSMNQISNRLSITKRKVQVRCEKCSGGE